MWYRFSLFGRHQWAVMCARELFYCFPQHTLISPLAPSVPIISWLPPTFPNMATYCCCCCSSNNWRNQYVIWRRRFSLRGKKGCGRRKSSGARFPNISSLIKVQRLPPSLLEGNWSKAWQVFIRVQTGSKSTTQRVSKKLQARSSLCT